MIRSNEKVVQAIAPVSANGAAFASTVIDTQGFQYLRFLAQFGSIGANVTALKVQEAAAKSNATTLTSGADVTGTVVATDTDETGTATALPVATTDNGKVWAFEIDLRGRKRYQQLQCTAGSGATLLSVVALLGRGEQSPSNATQKGVAAVLRVPKL
jgi:hypothetical protein